MKNKKIIFVVSIIAAFAIGLASDNLLLGKLINKKQTSDKPKDVYLEFISEVYGKIKDNYWDNISEEELIEMYRNGSERLTGMPQVLKVKNKEALLNLFTDIFKSYNNDQKKEFSLKISDLVLQSLKPAGRSKLYSQTQEENLKNQVNNVDPNKDLYNVLGVDKKASSEEIKKAFADKSKTAVSEEEKKQLAYASDVLTKEDTKKVYDETKAEPTVFARLLTPDIAYLKIKQMSPLTLTEFQKNADSITGSPTSLILDLRGNIGGAIDILPYFLGPFIGSNQYAYEFFKRGESIPFKTTTGWLPSLVKYKKVVVLIDGQTQSSAEVMAATLKRFRVGVLVGNKTRGWGTIERVFPIDVQIDPNEKFSMFLVHSLTLRDDNQPIEGNGVEPNVDIGKPDWEKEFNSYFNSTDLIEAVKSQLTL